MVDRGQDVGPVVAMQPIFNVTQHEKYKPSPHKWKLSFQRIVETVNNTEKGFFSLH